ncbi:MAG TPA: M20/M25/M40 family metallo-hydrolase [Bryobacteraceae bacterium]|nr:M20/M25/M40 family metallo-hydrolase [Bryobacteraceae bacterium]
MKRLCLLLLLPLGGFAAETMPPAAEQQLAREIYKQLIEIKSGFTTGATTPVAEAMAARFRAAGFADTDIFVGGAAAHKANLVVRYRGTGAQKPLLLLAHEDVVEAKREDWSVDPFVFLERDGYFYGRGSTDDKAQAAIWVATLLRMKREGVKANRDIILALTADEEGGGPYNGADWLVKNHRDLIDAELCLNEGGWGEMANGKKIANDVQVSEKYVINFRLEVHNKGGHSSLPVADNAIYHLAGALQNLSKFGFPLKTNDVTRAYFEKMANIATGPIAAAMAQIASGSQAAMEQVAAASPVWNSTLRTTCVATELEGGHAANALPQLAAANVNCRVMPDDSPDYVKNTLRKVFDDDKVEISIRGEVSQGPSSPLNQALMHTIQQVTNAVWPGVPVLPTMVPGATDGRYLRVVGIPTYGVQGFFLDVNDMRMHGRDERMPVQSFYQGQAFLYDLVMQLGGAKT